MKFVLKVLVLVVLVVISKLAKDEAVTLHEPVATEAASTNIFTSNVSQAPLEDRKSSVISVRYEKGSLQIN